MPKHIRRSTATWIPILLLTAALPLALGAQGDDSTHARMAGERIEVRVMNLEVVVTDRDGVRVPGLEVNNFNLRVNGEDVPLEYYTEIRENIVQTSAKEIPQLEAGSDAGVSFLIFVDNFFAIDRDKNQVVRALRERVENLRAQDQAAVVLWDGETLHTLTDWTTDKTQIVAALDKAEGMAALGLQRQQERRQFNASLSPQDRAMAESRAQRDPFHLGTQERMYADILVPQLQGTVAAATASLRGLEVPEGRKAALILSGGWPWDVANWIGRSVSGTIQEARIPNGDELYGTLSNAANLLGYTLYGVDLPGMQSRAENSAQFRAPQQGLGFQQFVLEGEIHNSLQFLAHQTGGLAMVNGMRIAALEEVGKDVRSYYWIGFTPEWVGDDQIHEIEVTVDDEDLLVRTRASFVDPSISTQVMMAVRSAVAIGRAQSDAVTVELGEGERVARRIEERPLTITVDAGAVQGQMTDDGYAVGLVMFVVALDRNGGRSEPQAIPLAFNSDRELGKGDDLNFTTPIQLRRNTREVRVAIFDPLSGQTLFNYVEL